MDPPSTVSGQAVQNTAGMTVLSLFWIPNNITCPILDHSQLRVFLTQGPIATPVLSSPARLLSFALPIRKRHTVPLSRKPDHIHDERDTRSHEVTQDEPNEERPGRAVALNATETNDDRFGNPDDEEWCDKVSHGYGGPCRKSNRMERKTRVSIANEQHQATGGSAGDDE